MSQSQESLLISQYEVQSECHSCSFQSSCRSTASQAAAKARPDAEAACARARYAKPQIDMEVENACIEAMLTALKQEGEAEAVHSVAQVLEVAAEEELHSTVNLIDTGIPVKSIRVC